MGHNTSAAVRVPEESPSNSEYYEVICKDNDNKSIIIKPSRHQSKSQMRRVLVKFIMTLSCRRKPRKPRKCRKNKTKMTSIMNNGKKNNDTSPVSSELQLHWFRSKHSLVSYALSKLAFFTRLSKDKLKDQVEQNDKQKNEKTVKFHRDNNANVVETLRKISLSNLNSNKELKGKLVNQLLLKHSSKLLTSPSKCSKPTRRGTKRKLRSPEEIYQRNLKIFERIVAFTASTSSSSSPSHASINILKPTDPMPIIAAATNEGVTAPANVTFEKESESKIGITAEDSNVEMDENQNPVERVPKHKLSSENSLMTTLKLPPKRLITTSKTPVEVDVYFMDWVKKKLGIVEEEPVTVQEAQTEQPASSKGSSASSEESKKKEKKDSKDKNNNNKAPEPPPEKKKPEGPFKFLRKGEGRRASVAGRSRSKSPGKGQAKKKKAGNRTSANTATTTATSTTPTTLSSTSKPCNNCGPCAGKGALSGAPPAYLDYGEGGAANATGEAWKGKRKGDPVMDRLKNVDVVEEMTYLVPVPDCGAGDGCGQMEEVDEDDCDYYAVCESCGEMEPVPEELKKELQQKRRKKKAKADSTPVTYSRRQRFNFKNKGDMCDDEDGPPYAYEGLQCPGASCRCSCCVAGLRRNPDCGCPCCETLGPARKCSSFDEFPVGKNPVIRRILCPEEICAKRREECMKRMPDTSGMYKFDLDNEIFERQVPRTPTPIVVEVEAPQPLTKQQLLALGREIQEKKRLGVGVDAYCPPVEQNPMYLPPIYGQCNPPCCVPNCCPPVCCGQGDEGKENKSETRYGSGYSYGSGSYYGSGYSYTGSAVSETQGGTQTATHKTTFTGTPQTTQTHQTHQSHQTTGPGTQQQVTNTKTSASSSESLPSQ